MPNLHILDGGVGKHLQFTALFDHLIKKENKLCLRTSWPELFKHDSRVASSTLFNIMPLHDNSHTYFKNYDNIIHKDPYLDNFVKGETHLVDFWAKMYGLENVSREPNFQVNTKREKFLQDDILKLGKFILVQFTGGQGVKSNDYDDHNAGRNYKDGQEVVNLLKEALPGLNIIVFGHDNEQEPLVNTTAFNNFGGSPKFVDKLDFMILARHCVSFICIDSSLQHMCSNRIFNKTGVVLWGTSKPSMFGYKKNINLISDYPYCVQIKPQDVVDNFLKMRM